MARGEGRRSRSSARTPQGRENEMIAMAYDLAEKQIREGTASAQVITHFLKMGSTRDRLEKELMAEKKKLMTAKTESIESQRRIEDLYKNALDAMRRYSGTPVTDNEDSEDY